MTEEAWIAVAFYALAAVLIASAVAVVTLGRIIHAALMLVVFFFAIAGIYILLSAEFIAAAQVLIYAGAITVLVLFAVMLTQRSYAPDSNAFNRQAGAALAVALLVLLAIVPPLLSAPWNVGGGLPDDVTRDLGRLMLREYVLPFEIASVLLLVAMIGAIVIARQEG